MTVWFTSDTHFGHERIIELCDRPFDNVNHMNEQLVVNWNSVVQPDDTVYHLGDVALGPWVEWNNVLSRLNGHKILIVGNHDRVFGDNSEKHRERFRPIYEQWFEGIEVSMGIGFLSKTPILLSHFPYDGDSHGDDRYSDYRIEDSGSLPLIHGHTHDRNQWFSLSAKGTPQFHVGVDAHNYTPVHEDLIKDWLKTLL